MHTLHHFNYSDTRDATSIEAIVLTVQQRAVLLEYTAAMPRRIAYLPKGFTYLPRRIASSREESAPIQELNSHTTSKIWSPSSTGSKFPTRKKEQSNKAFVNKQTHKALAERLKVLKLQKSGELAGYNFIGWLKKTGELVKDACPQSPHTPIYWKMPETGEWFCFSQQAGTSWNLYMKQVGHGF